MAVQLQAVSQELNSTLHPTLSDLKVAYVGETVVFTCVVRESNVVGWSSEEYISAIGRQIEFIATGLSGSRRYIGETVAVLVSARVNEVIVTQLQIRVKPDSPIASVYCHDSSRGTISSITFLVAS